MSASQPILLTTIAPAPAGFTLVELTKRHLLLEPVVVLVHDVAAVSSVLSDYATRMLGIVATPGEPFRLEQTSQLLWHATLPVPWLSQAAALVPGWLTAIGIADDANQKAYAAERRTERLARELEVTRRDYNELTTRLQGQVRDLLTAKNELSLLNERLESRVAERTMDLAHANDSLSKALEGLQQAQEELVRTAQLAGLGSLVAGIAHELNTPIGNAVTVATSLVHEARQLKSHHDNGTLKRSTLEQYVQVTSDVTFVLERNLLRAADIIGNFKQLTVDQVSENRRKFKLADVIANTMAAVSPQLRHTNYKVDLQIDSTLEMDSFPGAVSQVLTNFVTNAVMHAFEGRVHGTMTIRTAPYGDDALELYFSDDGAGIPTDRMERIFDPFFTTKFGQGGSGLGLYIVYNQVQKVLGGHLEVDSKPGSGTSFRLLLPRVAPDVCKEG